mmetsp:Transcript_14566/g.19437  ORF Transcript_14566/g.19437 Transcript_14566/m.19437 type:complete len:395 (-) Transcript_14566:467-1651(-)
MPPQFTENQTNSNTTTASPAEETHPSSISYSYDLRADFFDQALPLPFPFPTIADQNIIFGDLPIPETLPQAGLDPLFLSCDDHGEFSSDRIDSFMQSPPSSTAFTISYTYNVDSTTEGVNFIYDLEAEIFSTMAQSLLYCNGAGGRGLRHQQQQPNRRALTKIHSLESADNTPKISALRQCWGEDSENSYCFSVETIVSLFLENGEGDASSMIDAATRALRDVQDAMVDGTYVDLIPSLKKVILLQTNPEILVPSSIADGTPLEQVDHSSPSTKTSSISLGQDKQLQRSSSTVAVLARSSLTAVGVAVGLLAMFGAVIRRIRPSRHVEIIVEEMDQAPSSISSDSQVEQLEIIQSHMHKNDFSEESGSSTDTEWDFGRVAPLDTSSSGTQRSIV